MKTSQRYILSAAILIGFALFVNGLAYIVTRPEVMVEDPFKVSYKNTMKQSDAESVLAVIQAENFDNAFSHYSSYRDIPDTRFHDLRKAYLAARNELMDYVNEAAHRKIEVPYYLAEYK
jgi:hypothetical protein